jgi:alpha-L-fucosidase
MKQDAGSNRTVKPYIIPRPGLSHTTTNDAFYICSLVKPRNTIVLNSPVPWVKPDNVSVIGGSVHGEVVPAKMLENGSLELTGWPWSGSGHVYVGI